MSSLSTLLDRNKRFASSFSATEMHPIPKLRTIVLACGDARVDPAHVLGLDLGDAVVIRKNGGRVTRAFIDEIAALAVMVARKTQVEEASFDLVLMQHTQCGAERFADPEFQQALKETIGVDVSENAITDQMQDLQKDLGRLREAPRLLARANVIGIGDFVVAVILGILTSEGFAYVLLRESPNMVNDWSAGTAVSGRRQAWHDIVVRCLLLRKLL